MEQRQMLGDRYELHDPIGRGGMATIFRAYDTRMERMVAVKILREMYSSDPKFVLRFQREARAVSALSHPNIVQVFDYGRNNDEYYIVMELIEGTDLRRYLKTNGILDLRRAVVIAHDVALALGAAHQRGIVHRDVKPQNILVNDQALVKLTDFGIATFYRDMDNERLTTTGMTLGTVQYYAPEQAQGEVVTPAADVYSLGVVMYEMLVGHPPFDGDTPVAIAVRHIQETPARPSRFNPQIPIALERIIMRCLEKDPRDRYRDGDALAYALETFDKPRTPSGRIESAFPPGQPMGSAGVGYPNARRNSGPRQGPPGFDDGGDFLPGAFNQSPTRADVIPGTMGRADIAPPPTEDDKPSPAVGVTTAIIIASVLLLLGVGCFLAFKLGIIGGSGNTTAAQLVTVPNFFHEQYTKAVQDAKNVGLTLQETPDTSSTLPAGTITGQDPRAFTQAPIHSVVSVSVSQGQNAGQVKVPNVIGYSTTAACNKITSVGLICNRNIQPDTLPIPVGVLPGEVSRTDPAADTPEPANTTVTLYIAPTATATAGPTATATATASATATATPTASVTATPTTAPPTATPTTAPPTATPTP